MNQLIMQAAQQYRPEDRQKFVEYVRSEPMAAAQLRAPLFEDKVVDFLFAKAEISERDGEPRGARGGDRVPRTAMSTAPAAATTTTTITAPRRRRRPRRRPAAPKAEAAAKPAKKAKAEGRAGQAGEEGRGRSRSRRSRRRSPPRRRPAKKADAAPSSAEDVAAKQPKREEEATLR